ncbi:MAG: hypothetical protein IT316_15270 [Anaerolineales bacterium]|nr:hypothetical protein [Anaerolineales bacterium]
MKRRKAVLGIIALIALIILGALIYRPAAPPPENSPWMKKWLNDPTCLPPCWENIIPGETDIGDSIALLEQVEEINNETIKMFSGDWSEVQWAFKDSSSWGRVWTTKKDTLIHMTRFATGDSVTITEIEAKYGAPQEVLISRCMSGFCDVVLIYKDLSMGLDVFTRERRQAGIRLRPDQVVYKIEFYSNKPGDVPPYTLDWNYPQRTYAWKGYTTYP